MKRLGARAGCLAVFLLPFAGAGLAGLYASARALMEGNHGAAAVLALFGLVFLGAVGLVVGAFFARTDRTAENWRAQMRSHEPERPWLWRRDWSEGRVEHVSSSAGFRMMWIFALVWNGSILAAGVAFLSQPAKPSERLGLLLFFIPFLLVGVLVLKHAVQAAIAHRHHRRSIFELGRVPFALGDRVSGWVTAPPALRSATAVRLTLDCVEVSRGDSPDRVLFREEHSLPVSAVSLDPDGARVPVSMAIPSDQPTSRDDDFPRPEIKWRLAVKAPLTGSEYESTFDVPVFPAGTAPSRVSNEPDPATVAPPTGEGAEQIAAAKGYRLEPVVGGTALQYPATKGSLGCFLFLVLLVLAPVALRQVESLADIEWPLVIAVTCGLAVLGFALAVLGIFIAPRRALVQRGELVIERSALGLSSHKRIPVSEVTEVRHKTTGQSGQVRFDVEVQAGTRKHTAASGLEDLEVAKWLAGELRRLVAEEAPGR